MKYYWVCYGFNSTSFITENEVTDVHPFSFIEVKNKNKGWLASTAYLINWKEISREEYDLFNEKKS